MRLLVLITTVLCLGHEAYANSQCTCSVRKARSLMLKLSDGMSTNGYPDNQMMKSMSTFMDDFEKALNTWTEKYNFDLNDWLKKNDMSMDESMENIEKWLDKFIIPMKSFKNQKI